MADGILFFEGWEGDITGSVWENIAGGFLQTDMIDPQWKRSGNYGYRFAGNGNGTSQSPLWVPTDYIIVGFAFKWIGQGGGVFGDGILDIRGPGDIGHVALYFNTQNVFGFRKPDGFMNWSVRTLDVDSWYYIEVRIKIHNTLGSLELWINGGADIVVTGVDTATGSDPAGWFCNQIGIGRFDGFTAGQGPTDYWYDDIYVRDANVNPLPLGDAEVIGYALEDDAVIQFTRSSGTKNYQMVDELTPDEDGTYVYTNVSGHQDFYEVADTAFAGEIYAVQLVSRGKKTATQIWTFENAIKIGANTLYGTPRYMTFPEYETYQPDVFGDAPGSVGWTAAQFNSMTVGFRVLTP